MKPGVKAQLLSNLKFLKLSAMLAELEVSVRQASESNTDYGELLLQLTEIEVAARMENGRKRRIQEAKFPLLKPIETFEFEAAPAKRTWPRPWV